MNYTDGDYLGHMLCIPYLLVKTLLEWLVHFILISR